MLRPTAERVSRSCLFFLLLGTKMRMRMRQKRPERETAVRTLRQPYSWTRRTWGLPAVRAPIMPRVRVAPMRKPRLPAGRVSAMTLREHMKPAAEPAPMRMRESWARAKVSVKLIKRPPEMHRRMEAETVILTPNLSTMMPMGIWRRA